MTLLDYAAFAFLVLGLAIRISTSGRYIDAYWKVYRSHPTRTWMFHGVSDAEVERLRRFAASGSVLMIVGVLILLFSAVTRS